jgi:hypothetical protein
MPSLFGQDLTMSELQRRVGDLSQAFGVRLVEHRLEVAEEQRSRDAGLVRDLVAQRLIRIGDADQLHIRAARGELDEPLDVPVHEARDGQPDRARRRRCRLRHRRRRQGQEGQEGQGGAVDCRESRHGRGYFRRV